MIRPSMKDPPYRIRLQYHPLSEEPIWYVEKLFESSNWLFPWFKTSYYSLMEVPATEQGPAQPAKFASKEAARAFLDGHILKKNAHEREEVVRLFYYGSHGQEVLPK